MTASDIIVKALRYIGVNVNAATLTLANSSRTITAGKIVVLALRKMGVTINEDTLNPPSAPTAFTAGDLIEETFKKLAILSRDTATNATEQSDAITELNNMMLQLEASGVELGYTPVSSTSDIITTPNYSWRMMYTQLAVIIASQYGKEVPQMLILDAQQARVDTEKAIKYQDTLEQLNDIMAEYQASQVDLGYVDVSAFSDTISAPPYSWKMMYTRLAVALSEEYGKEVTAMMLQELQLSKDDIVKIQQYEQLVEDLNSMMRTLEANNIVLGWTPCRDLSSNITVPDWAIEMITYRLAITLAPQYGKRASAELTSLAKESYDAVLNQLREHIAVKLPADLPTGSGNRTWGGYGTFSRNFIGDQSSDDILTGNGDGLQDETASQLTQDNGGNY